MKLEFYKFVIDEMPYCVSMWDLSKRNEEFIDRFDPGYFEYLSSTYCQTIASKESNRDRHYGAVALRAAYSHGLETLFAILGATLQAPHCVAGWLMKYSTQNLISLVQKIHTHKKILTLFRMDEVSWKGVADLVFHHFALDDEQDTSKIKASFARSWQRLAAEFLDQKNRDENNSIKHGFRLNPGGFQLAFGIQKDPKVPAKKLESLGGSEFGSTSFSKQRFDKYNFHLIKNHRNWVPENFVNGLTLISGSIRNITSFLKLVNGKDPKEVRFRWPTNESDFDAPWALSSGVTDFKLDPVLSKENLKLFSKEDILSVFNTG